MRAVNFFHLCYNKLKLKEDNYILNSKRPLKTEIKVECEQFWSISVEGDKIGICTTRPWLSKSCQKINFSQILLKEKILGPFIYLFSHKEQKSVACCSQMSTLAPGSCLFCIFLCNRIFAFHTLLQDNLWDGGIKWLISIFALFKPCSQEGEVHIF